MRMKDEVRPTLKQHVIELVAATGVDVSNWAVSQAGKPVRVPSANPAYCYERAHSFRNTRSWC